MRQKKTIQSLVACVMQKYRLLSSSFTRHNDKKSEKNIYTWHKHSKFHAECVWFLEIDLRHVTHFSSLGAVES
jgi:hypothetical protein